MITCMFKLLFLESEIVSSCRQYTGSTFDPDPDILGLFSNFENHLTDEVGHR